MCYLSDYKKVLELDGSQLVARQAMVVSHMPRLSSFPKILETASPFFMHACVCSLTINLQTHVCDDLTTCMHMSV